MARATLGQRLLGAGVLLSLGFIGYSVFLQSNSGTYIDRSAQIPNQTKFIEPLSFEEPRGVYEDTALQDPSEMFNPTEPADLSQLDSAAPVDDEGNPNSWVIQVGSFSTAERASEIRDELLSSGYKAYVRILQADTIDAEFHRVLVGPYLGADEVRQHQSEIDEILSLETILIDYVPY